MGKLKFLSMLVVLAMLLAACGGAPAAPPADAPAADAPAAEQPAAAAPSGEVAMEAPILAEAVAAGTLPPLEERLPAVPFVVGPGVLLSEANVPNWAPGQYGCTMNSAHSVADWSPDVYVVMSEPLLQAPGLGVHNIQRQVLAI